MNKKALFLIITIVAGFLFTSCSTLSLGSGNEDDKKEYNFFDSQDDVIDTGPVKGGTLKFYSTIPDTLNPILTNNLYIRDYASFVYESLVAIDKNQKAVPVLADRWEVSPDGLTWTFHLKEDILWHDGMPFSSEDVEFTVNSIISSPNSSYKQNVENIVSIAAADSKTFKVVLENPNSFTAELMTFPILSKHQYVGEDLVASEKNNSPIGTGPYKFVEYKVGSNIKLSSNEKWWKSQKRDENALDLPYIEEIDIRVFDKNKSNAAAFQGGDADLLTIDRTWWSKYNGRSDIMLKRYTSNKYEYIAFNLSNKILKSTEVRQAIAYTVDKTKIINDLLPGEAVASDLPIIPDTWLNDTKAVYYNEDKEMAKKLLEDSGWEEENGILYNKINGVKTPLKLEMLVNNDNALRIKVANEIKAQLKEIGIELSVKEMSWEDEFKNINRKKFDMVLLGCTVTTVPDISFMYSSEVGTLNISGYKNEDVDKYLKMIIGERNEPVKKAYFTNMKELINQDIPYLGLYFYNDAVVYSKRIKGEFAPHLWNKYFDMTKWYIPVT